MNSNHTYKAQKISAVIAPVFAFLFILFLYGALPFIATPTLGQAIWLTGFAQSFANNSIFTIHATNFGYPEPAAIAFGLSGAYPVSIFLRLGLHPADAYALMHVLWLAVAFLGTWKISRNFFKQSTLSASILSTLWLSLPIVWGHTGYSALAIGIGLLPFYFWTSLELFEVENFSPKEPDIGYKYIPIYLFATLTSVFMDGYSFMMFAVASSFLGFYKLIVFAKRYRQFFIKRLGIHFLCFAIAYALYALYIGQAQFGSAPLDFFRGWGVDLAFLTIPTERIHWLWDFLGVSRPRVTSDNFGDSSVWKTTYSLPLIILGCVAWWRTRKNSKLATIFLITALFGLYMALGPALKVNSVRPESMSQMMPAEFGILPTGNGLLSSSLPGFRNMRAAYRWTALACLGFWLLAGLLLANEKNQSKRRLILSLCVLLIVSNLPNLEKQFSEKHRSRQKFLDIDQTIISDIDNHSKDGEVLAFLPYGNDFFVNYIASETHTISYNIGGDKNLHEARKHWPEVMSGFEMNAITDEFTDRLVALLATGEADAVVLPYIDLLKAPHAWPTQSELEEQIRQLVGHLNDYDFLSLEDSEYYTIVRLAEEFEEAALKEDLASTLCILPTCVEYDPSERVISDIPTQIGIPSETGVKTTATPGYLAFGPYVELEPGDYDLEVKGIVGNTDNGNIVIDIISHNPTQTVFASFENVLSKNTVQTADISQSILSERVSIDKDVDDLEVRVYVDENVDFTLTSYTLQQQ